MHSNKSRSVKFSKDMISISKYWRVLSQIVGVMSAWKKIYRQKCTITHVDMISTLRAIRMLRSACRASSSSKWWFGSISTLRIRCKRLFITIHSIPIKINRKVKLLDSQGRRDSKIMTKLFLFATLLIIIVYCSID